MEFMQLKRQFIDTEYHVSAATHASAAATSIGGDSSATSITLLDGSVTSPEAYDSVHRLIAKTQEFLAMRDFGCRERHGHSDDWSTAMLASIENDSDDIQALLESASTSGKNVRVVAQIRLELDD